MESSNDREIGDGSLSEGSVPLIVDLDGTLIRSDLLVESVFALFKQNILYLFLIPIWLLKGKANLKYEIASRVDIDAALLPYNDDFLAFLSSEAESGRRIALATASNEKFANAVAQHLGFFDDVFASDATTNLSGSRKLGRIRESFGDGGFDYAANARVDVPIWEVARSAYLVNPERGVRKAAEKTSHVARVFDDRTDSSVKVYLKALRIHQWLKNLLVFVPLLMSHRFDEPALIGQALLAFLAFGLCASSVYLLNDLMDLPEDRQHPTKRERPFAAGTISIVNGVLLIPALLVASFGVASLLPIEFAGVLALYYVITLAYSIRLKRAALVDVLTLAGLYTMRIIGGAAAVEVEPSFWLLAFSMFLFLSMALVKRFTELLTLRKQGREAPPGRGYSTDDLEILSQFGTASAYMAVLVLALYINSEAVSDLYAHPQVIWLLCPLLLYMVTRVWLMARRDEVHEDPVVFLIKDGRSQLLIVIGAIFLWLAI